MLKKVGLGIVGVVVLAVGAVLLIAATKPATFKVERQTVIAAPSAAIFANLEDFHRWAAWSPWEHLDPQMRKTYSGPPTGVGSSYAWTGNSDVGEGRMTVLESRPNEELKVKLEFLKPFEATNTTTYTLAPNSGHNGTQVTWSMEGPNTFMGKVMSVFASMDSMVGKDFEIGLANLKRVSESAPSAAN
jgi:uncharacterized protein YndB with AHSA1/START domain